MNRSRTMLLSLLLIAACTIAGIYGVRASKNQSVFGLGDFSHISPETAVSNFEESQTNEDLILLLKVLCYQVVVEGNGSVQSQVAAYGTLFYDRVRNGTANPATLGSDEEMLELLDWIQRFGAQRLPGRS